MSGDAAAWLRELFGESLFERAQELERTGSVRDLRVLQGGQVATGAVLVENVTAKHRVYIRRATGANSLQAECSCGAPKICDHSAAVAVAAFASTRPTVAPRPGSPSTPQRWLARGASQSLCYVLDTDADGAAAITMWVSQGPTAFAEPVPFNAASARREGSYPRYVTAEDRKLLDTLDVQHQHALLPHVAGFECLQLLLATARARWRSMSGPVLKWAGERRLAFEWCIQQDGAQRLIISGAEQIELLVNDDLLLYVDSASGDCGTVNLHSSPAQFRGIWSRGPTPAEEVAALNATLIASQLNRDVPLARALEVREEGFATLHGALYLSKGPVGEFGYVYNGVTVHPARIAQHDPYVRFMRDDILYRVARSTAEEQRIRGELDAVLPTPSANRGMWLDFMLKRVPALRASGWSIEVKDDFPYRIAMSTDDWQIVAHDSDRADWFDLRLEIRVDGVTINLLPVLVSYLQARLDRRDHDYVRAGDHLFVRMPDDRYLPLSLSRIERIADALIELYRSDALNAQQAVTLRRSQLHRVAQLLTNNDAIALRAVDPDLAAKIESLRIAHSPPVAAPEGFQVQLRGYQLEALGWLQKLRTHGLGGVLADDMGLGKTVQTLAHLAVEKLAGRLRHPALIVAPVSVLGNWRQEMQRFAPMLRSLLLHGDRRATLFAQISNVDIVITGYPQLLLDQATLMR
ncbi:MAG TPA: DEAD/DEAH box helicase, partial [Steroidobacteraceae bacterium]|nr:DEAD/DEAH box helicase [Steroidobacteraceae bacterium]